MAWASSDPKPLGALNILLSSNIEESDTNKFVVWRRVFSTRRYNLIPSQQCCQYVCKRCTTAAGRSAILLIFYRRACENWNKLNSPNLQYIFTYDNKRRWHGKESTTTGEWLKKVMQNTCIQILSDTRTYLFLRCCTLVWLTTLYAVWLWT